MLAILAFAVLCLLVGCAVGARYARAHRGWADFRKTKASLPGLRKDAWALTRRAAGGVFVVGVLAVALVVGAAANSNAGS